MKTETAMTNSPETRFSLICRLSDHCDEQAWSEFVQLYQPLIFRVARRKGLQHADASEVSQEVLRRVAQAINQWDNDPGKGSFRGWLYRITRNATIDHLRKSTRTVNLDSTAGPGLHELVDSADADHQQFEMEYRRSLLALAAGRIQKEFQPRTWQAFWRTTVGGEAIEAVGEALNMTAGAIYIARSRVMKRLATEIERDNNESIGW